jgi:hypothetical protein
MPGVQVRIEWPDGVMLPEGAWARVTIEDVSQMDSESIVVAERVIEHVSTDAPLVTEVEVGTVNPGSDFVVRVHVSSARGSTSQVESGDLLSTQSHPVLTQGHGRSAVVRPQRVGG